ncbi:MAG: hypothetical protein QW728_05670, partial [Thermoplasmata archaeon]
MNNKIKISCLKKYNKLAASTIRVLGIATYIILLNLMINYSWYWLDFVLLDNTGLVYNVKGEQFEWDLQFNDTFDSGLSGWTTHSGGVNTTGGTATITSDNTILTRGNITWADYLISGRFRLDTNASTTGNNTNNTNRFDVYFRIASITGPEAGEFYRFSFYQNQYLSNQFNGYCSYNISAYGGPQKKFISSKDTGVGSSGINFTEGIWYTFTIPVIGSYIGGINRWGTFSSFIILNGTETWVDYPITYEGSTPVLYVRNGMVGFGGTANVSIDYLSVSTLRMKDFNVSWVLPENVEYGKRFNITIKINDTSGNPVANATVVVHSSLDTLADNYDPRRFSIRTESSGRVDFIYNTSSFSTDVEDILKLTVSKPGFNNYEEFKTINITGPLKEKTDFERNVVPVTISAFVVLGIIVLLVVAISLSITAYRKRVFRQKQLETFKSVLASALEDSVIDYVDKKKISDMQRELNIDDSTRDSMVLSLAGKPFKELIREPLEFNTAAKFESGMLVYSVKISNNTMPVTGLNLDISWDKEKLWLNSTVPAGGTRDGKLKLATLGKNETVIVKFQFDILVIDTYEIDCAASYTDALGVMHAVSLDKYRITFTKLGLKSPKTMSIAEIKEMIKTLSFKE